MTSAKMKREMAESMNAVRPSSPARDAEFASTIFGQISEQKAPPTDVPTAAIVPSPFQRRTKLDEEHVADLAESIGADTLLEPVIVRLVGDKYELIAGHHRVEACRKLGWVTIPAHVRTMDDAHAARALTVNNTQHSGLTDYERYLHLVMLREQKAYRNKTDLATLLGVGRGSMYNVEAFGELPSAALEVVAAHSQTIGGAFVYKLQSFCKSHPTLVTEAIGLVADGKLTQASAPSWIASRVNPATPKERKNESRVFGSGGVNMKFLMSDAGAKIDGDLDYEKVFQLLVSNFDSLKKDKS